MRKHIRSGSPYEGLIGFSRAIIVGSRILVSGTAPVPPQGQPLADSAYGQMMRCGEIVKEALVSAGATLTHVVRTRMYLVNVADADEVGRAHKELFDSSRPASTMVVVAALLDPRWRIELEVEAILD